MPLPIFLSGAMLSGFATGLWSYNRENYMWDWQVRQSSDFQRQNILVSRFSLFREDIRDLAGLTTSKMNNYLVVNTLKLGFIVGAFFNYDRSDVPGAEGSPIERQVVLIFTTCFVSAFYLLLMSVWFSMHASVIAQSFMTKMLLTTVRIPFPTDEDIKYAAPEARDYEGALSTAFRVPLMSSVSRRTNTQSSSTRSVSSNLSTGVSGHLDNSPYSSARTLLPHLEGREASHSSVQSMESQEPAKQAGGAFQAPLAPHLKFYSILMSSWQPFDLYAKISMSIGTSCMLSGFAYFALYYTRYSPADFNRFRVPPEGWFTFAFMEILAWWSFSLDLVLSRLEQTLGTLLAIGTAAIAFFCLNFESESIDLMPVVVMVIKATCVVLICLSGLPHHDGWPRRWRASLFMNIIGTRSSGQSEGSSKDAMGLPASGSQCKPAQASELAGRLLHVFRQIQQLPLPPPEAEHVHQMCLHLTRVTGGNVGPDLAPGSGQNQPSGSDGCGFWVVTPSLDMAGKTQTSWIRTPTDPEGKLPSTSESTTLEELLGAARATLDSLKPESAESWMWTPEDAERLASYGGALDCEDVKGLESQGCSKGSAAKSVIGKKAHRFFRVSISVVCLMWLTACICCYLISAVHLQRKPHHRSATYLGQLVKQVSFLWFGSASTDELARTLSSKPLVLPRPWYSPTSMSCNPDGQRLVLSDGARAFVSATNGSGWLGPFGACGGAEVAAAAFVPGAEEEHEPELVATSSDGALPLPCGPSSVERCEAARWAASAEQQASAAALGPRLSLVALDPAPLLSSAGSSLAGFALQDGQLVALEPAAGGAWRVARVLPGPRRGKWERRRWVGLAMHAGLGLALDAGGAVYELDAMTGDWSGPRLLEEAGRSWRGICLLPKSHGGQWLLLGERTARGPGTGGHARHSLELWRFVRPRHG